MSIQLTELESKIVLNFHFSERDSRRLARSIEDIARLCGFETQEIYEFLLFGAELELETLKETYDWERFNR
ncbi:MAG: hypothetical protein SFU98_14970, partial [Leptospiraceae bacterium]|nr:hypothetical protein [Leptospiraceae bacterium]